MWECPEKAKQPPTSFLGFDEETQVSYKAPFHFRNNHHYTPLTWNTTGSHPLVTTTHGARFLPLRSLHTTTLHRRLLVLTPLALSSP